MRRSLLVVSLTFAGTALAGLTTMGCATSMGSASGDGRVVVAVDAPPQSSSELVQVTEVVQPVAPEAATPARRRLSEVVTLGQGTAEPIYVPGQQQQAQAATNGVVVNNNITVVNGQPGYGYGGYYGGYGYGGYGGGRGSSAPGTSRDGRGGMAGNGAWAPSGWEGAQRTAAPGHTPGVGGNWSSAPSHGPRSQR
jgi:hypothetical protein